MPKRIMLVDDESELTDLLAEFFRAHQWEVGIAVNGKQAIENLQQFSADVIVADIKMPVMDGLELLDMLILSESETPVIFLSGFRNGPQMQQAWEQGAFDFMDKPVDMKMLLASAERAYKFGRDYVQIARRRLPESYLFSCRSRIKGS
ncbi:MAG: hypothetical protein COT73_06920 [Bdellovibrio sp. CG10_big_fil_rev_8_21_14_0_10_47_8]|nr:MAG: hypothetical protein COT73_06920 [Bdellovibrio sp. CG10_big_fil_rev_8_21_14_0_10_47_8]